jgi:cell division protein FtsL
MSAAEHTLHPGWDKLGKAIDNSQVVREADPRASRHLWLLLGLVMALVGALGLYAWPNLKLRETALGRERMVRERERLLEVGRKLRLEKAMLEDLRRVDTIARRDLGLAPPAADKLVVVERQAATHGGALVSNGAGGR